MQERISLILDDIDLEVLIRFILALGPNLDKQWASSCWTWLSGSADVPQEVNAAKDFELSLRSKDFAAVYLPCRMHFNDHYISGNLYVERNKDSSYFLAITPHVDARDEIIGEWVSSLESRSADLEPILAIGVEVRIAIEVSMSNEVGGKLAAVRCCSVTDIVSLYSQWRSKLVSSGSSKS